MTTRGSGRSGCVGSSRANRGCGVGCFTGRTLLGDLALLLVGLDNLVLGCRRSGTHGSGQKTARRVCS